MPNVYVHAEENTDIVEAISKGVQAEAEEVVEAMADSMSINNAGDWRTAIFVDGFYWNSFHNAVQKHIRDNNPGVDKRELWVTFFENSKKVGYGKGDLSFYDGKYTYIWEVKPYSYSVEPKRSLGVAQLERYRATNIYKYRIGGNQISGGTTYLYKDVVYTGYVEHITYEINYTIEYDGLILYSFIRHVNKEETSDENVQEPVGLTVPSKVTSLNEIFNPGYVNTTEVGIDVEKIVAYVAMATAWGTHHDRINSNPHTANSLSTSISLACKAFLISVGATGSSFIFSPETVNAAEINDAVYEFELALETYGGSEIVDELLEALESEDEETIEELIKELQGESEKYDEASQAQPPKDPLVIDFGAEGFELTSLTEGVNFDLDNNGFAEKTAWIGTDDGFLAYDRNGNGTIDNGGELFGDRVILEDDSISESGFEALAEMDGNQDKIINADDSDFGKLMVWTDANHNGISEAEELKRLSEHGIVSISLEHSETSFTDVETGTLVAECADVILTVNGESATTEISEFWFPVNSSDTTQGGGVTVGNIPDINQAIIYDESGELFELCYLFGETDNIGERRYYLRQILYFIVGATDISADSRGGNIDARDLKVIEQFMGREFAGVGGSNPNESAANILKEIYGNIENQYYNILNQYCGFGGYLNTVYEYEDENGNMVLNLSFLNYKMLGSKALL